MENKQLIWVKEREKKERTIALKGKAACFFVRWRGMCVYIYVVSVYTCYE